jgi:hypothetical protein
MTVAAVQRNGPSGRPQARCLAQLKSGKSSSQASYRPDRSGVLRINCFHLLPFLSVTLQLLSPRSGGANVSQATDEIDLCSPCHGGGRGFECCLSRHSGSPD